MSRQNLINTEDWFTTDDGILRRISREAMVMGFSMPTNTSPFNWIDVGHADDSAVIGISLATPKSDENGSDISFMITKRVVENPQMDYYWDIAIITNMGLETFVVKHWGESVKKIDADAIAKITHLAELEKTVHESYLKGFEDGLKEKTMKDTQMAKAKAQDTRK